MTPLANEHHLRALERMYLKAPVNEKFHPEVHIEEGACDIILPVRETDFHAAHAVHGHVLFKALDDAAFFAANSVVEDRFVLTAGFHIDFVRPVSSGSIHARGELTHPGKRRMLCDAVARDDDGRVLARGGGSFMVSNVALGPDVGYGDRPQP